MRGKFPLSYLWRWLGQGSLGEEYEAITALQPIVNVDGLEWPIQMQSFDSGAIALSAGSTALFVQGAPDGSQRLRLWLNLWCSRSNVAAGDVDRVLLNVTGNNRLLLEQRSGASFPAGSQIPLIGGVARHLNGAALLELRGLRPLVAHNNIDGPQLVLEAVAAAAVGTVTWQGIFVDVPESAPLPGLLF